MTKKPLQCIHVTTGLTLKTENSNLCLRLIFASNLESSTSCKIKTSGLDIMCLLKWKEYASKSRGLGLQKDTYLTQSVAISLKNAFIAVVGTASTQRQTTRTNKFLNSGSFNSQIMLRHEIVRFPCCWCYGKYFSFLDSVDA